MLSALFQFWVLDLYEMCNFWLLQLFPPFCHFGLYSLFTHFAQSCKPHIRPKLVQIEVKMRVLRASHLRIRQGWSSLIAELRERLIYLSPISSLNLRNSWLIGISMASRFCDLIDILVNLHRLSTDCLTSNIFEPYDCAVCQLEMKPGEGISVHGTTFKPTGVTSRWDGPFLCVSCQTKKEAMEGKSCSQSMNLFEAKYCQNIYQCINFTWYQPGINYIALW